MISILSVFLPFLGLKSGVSAGQGNIFRNTPQSDPHATFSSFFHGADHFDIFGEADGEEDLFNPFRQFTFSHVPEAAAGGGPRKPPRRLQGQAVVHELPVTLDDVMHGCTKQVKVTRSRLGADGRSLRSEDKVLSVVVKKGWRSGTRITFPREGDETPDSSPADITFVLRDQEHPSYKRDGSNIALCGCTVNVPTLDNRMMPLPCSDVIKPGAVRRLRGEGLPLARTPSQRGDLVVEFQVLFPDRIPPQSREIIKHSLGQC
ncbi:unnamed protein product [Menidia menidia]|uniref:(Atlantic silverside) hypothetical protein n=1 Tax=Menidia menidia TaxID=238744 RepID=A0A8S4BU75_9TELE|nr:unnamed protein product [Menidia menidia]